jgi:selenocysteine-specific elongation factor
MKSITIGTAGHIDHGKSALVRALTGKDPDRLPEEKRRGITIDLGFADVDLGEVRIGFVDVPGHERFVKNMLAGAHGIDAVALVIAADEGVMPQTREHFDICRLLGIRNGLVVITKSDLVEEALLQLVHDEAEDLVKGSFLEDSPILTVSARTGAGLDQLKEMLLKVAANVPERSVDFVPRLPVDRVFSMKGFGAVVTGTLVAGQIQEGDELELLPRGVPVRVRGVQVHGKTVSQAQAGQRTAVNLGGIDTSEVGRGMVLAPKDRLRASQILDVRLEVLPNVLRPVRSRARVRLHIHAAEVLGRIRVIEDQGLIEPGQAGFAQLRLETPVVAVMGERFILRTYSPSQTIAGGHVLDPLATKHRGRDFARVRTQLNTLNQAERVAQLSTFVNTAGDFGLNAADLAGRTGWTDGILLSLIKVAQASNVVKSCEGRLLAPANFSSLSTLVIDEVKTHHAREPLSRGLSKEKLREQHFAHLPPEIFRGVIARLEESELVVSEKDVLKTPEHSLEVKGADADLRNNVERVYAESGLEPPTLEDALTKAGVTKSQQAHGRKLLQLLIDKGTIVRLQGDMLFHRRALEGLQLKLREYGDSHEPERLIDVAAFKNLAGVSRKYAIPLLEFFDRERITRRAGDKRLILK